MSITSASTDAWPAIRHAENLLRAVVVEGLRRLATEKGVKRIDLALDETLWTYDDSYEIVIDDVDLEAASRGEDPYFDLRDWIIDNRDLLARMLDSGQLVATKSFDEDCKWHVHTLDMSEPITDWSPEDLRCWQGTISAYLA